MTMTPIHQIHMLRKIGLPLDMWIFVNHAPDDTSGGCDDGDTSDGDVISTCLSSIMRRTLHPRSGRQVVKCTFVVLHHRFGQV